MGVGADVAADPVEGDAAFGDEADEADGGVESFGGFGDGEQLSGGDVAALPWPDDRFSVVTCMGSFEAFPDPAAAQALALVGPKYVSVQAQLGDSDGLRDEVTALLRSSVFVIESSTGS